MKHYFSYALILSFGLILIWLNTMVPYMPWDDYLYHHKFDESRSLYELDLIQSIGDYFISLKEHYLSYNNRIFPHALLQALLQLGKPFFNVLNSLLFLLIPIFIYKAATPESSFKNFSKYCFIVATIMLFIWCFHFDLGMSYFWTTGSLNYTWMLPFQLYLLYGFYRIYLGLEINFLALFSSSIFVCTTNENAVLSLFLLGVLVLFFDFLKNQKLNLKLLTVVAILLIGGLIMFFSPALSAKQSDHAIPFDSKAAHLKEYIVRQAYFFFKYLPVLIFFPFRSWKSISINKFQFGLLAVVLFSNLIMYLAPLAEPRTAVFGFIVLLVFILNVLSQLDLLNAKFLKIRFVGLLVFSVVLLGMRIPSFQEIKSLSNANHIKLSEGKNQDVVVPGYYDSDRFNALYAEQFSKITEHNKLVANFYGQNSVTLSKRSFEKEYQQLNLGNFENYEVRLLNKELDDHVVIKALHIKKLEQDLNAILFELEGIDPGYRIMFRAAKKRSLKHKFVGFLPFRIQKYLLDYMIFDEAPIRINGKLLYFNHSKSFSKYDYFLIGLYDPNKHAQVGDIIKYKIQF